jgi:hypothetical protein
MKMTGPLAKETALLVVVVLLLSVASFSGCGNDRAPPQFSKDIVERLDSAIASEMKYNDVPGVVVGVWEPGEGQYVVARGKANLETGERRDLNVPSGSPPSPRRSPPRPSCSLLSKGSSPNPTHSPNGTRTFPMPNRSP